MIEILKKQYRDEMTSEEKINRVREFLQVLILKIIYELRYFKNLSFVGGTALRFLFDLQRFSENIDFSLVNKKNYVFHKMIQNIKSQLIRYGLDVEIEGDSERVVQNAMVKFKDVLYNLGLSNIKEQKLFVKIEIDTNPPEGWNNQISLINRTYVFTVTHFDLPSLYSTKLHACFFRKYTKGRDIYDFIWYLGKNITPNFKLLNNAIIQTEKKDLMISSNNFKQFLIEKTKYIDFEKAKKDVERFLVDKGDLKLFDRKLIQNIIENKY